MSGVTCVNELTALRTLQWVPRSHSKPFDFSVDRNRQNLKIFDCTKSSLNAAVRNSVFVYLIGPTVFLQSSNDYLQLPHTDNVTYVQEHLGSTQERNRSLV